MYKRQRSAIAKFSNIHFSSCKDSSLRLQKWGEKKSRIFQVGAPQLDDIDILSKKKKKKNEAKEALAKASGGEELEIAAKILGELRERNKRKKIIEDRS